MRFKKLLIIIASIVATLSFTGCTPYQEGLATGVVVGAAGASAYSDNYRYEGYNYGINRNDAYRRGVRDGCRSKRQGRTIRNTYQYRNNYSYRSGWRAGYNQCRKSYDTRNYYNRGYNDGCWSKRHPGTRKNRNLYRNNRSYKNGWNRGYRNCHRRY